MWLSYLKKGKLSEQSKQYSSLLGTRAGMADDMIPMKKDHEPNITIPQELVMRRKVYMAGPFSDRKSVDRSLVDSNGKPKRS